MCAVFRIVLPCTGKANAEVDVNVYINVTHAGNMTALTLKRKKICLKDTSTTVRDDEPATDESAEGDEVDEEEPPLAADPSAIVSSSNPLYIAVGCASGFIFLLSSLAMLCYVRSHKARNSELGK